MSCAGGRRHARALGHGRCRGPSYPGRRRHPMPSEAGARSSHRGSATARAGRSSLLSLGHLHAMTAGSRRARDALRPGPTSDARPRRHRDRPCDLDRGPSAGRDRGRASLSAEEKLREDYDASPRSTSTTCVRTSRPCSRRRWSRSTARGGRACGGRRRRAGQPRRRRDRGALALRARQARCHPAATETRQSLWPSRGFRYSVLPTRRRCRRTRFSISPRCCTSQGARLTLQRRPLEARPRYGLKGHIVGAGRAEALLERLGRPDAWVARSSDARATPSAS